MTGFELRPMVSEATALLTEPLSLPHKKLIKLANAKKYTEQGSCTNYCQNTTVLLVRLLLSKNITQ